jgi:hypothetical protein
MSPLRGARRVKGLAPYLLAKGHVLIAGNLSISARLPEHEMMIEETKARAQRAADQASSMLQSIIERRW